MSCFVAGTSQQQGRWANGLLRQAGGIFLCKRKAGQTWAAAGLVHSQLLHKETSLTHLQDALEAQAEVLDRLPRKRFLKFEREREKRGCQEGTLTDVCSDGSLSVHEGKQVPNDFLAFEEFLSVSF